MKISEEDISEEDISVGDISEEDISEEDISEEEISEEDISKEDISDEDISKVIEHDIILSWNCTIDKTVITVGEGRITITLHEQQSISFIRGNLMPHCVANFLIYFNYLAIENQVARLDFFHQSIKLSQTFFISSTSLVWMLAWNT